MAFGSLWVGAVVSETTTLKEPSALLPDASVAVQETVVSPSAKVLPEDGVQITSTGPSTTSVAAAWYSIVAPFAPWASMLMSSGRSSCGPVVSVTITLKLPLALLPARSSAEQVTCVVPRAKVESLAGKQLTPASVRPL